MIYGPRIAEWTDAELFRLTRDTRWWVTHDHEGHGIGDWVDTRAHLLVLYSLARYVCCLDPMRPHVVDHPPLCLEVGVRHGITTMALLHAMRETGGRLISLEIAEGPLFVALERVEAAKLSCWWQPVLRSSDAFAEHDLPTLLPSLDLLWLDGDHSYEQTKRDVDNYSPWVRPGGFVVLHDSANVLEPGVVQVVAEMKDSGKYEMLTLCFSYGMTIARVVG